MSMGRNTRKTLYCGDDNKKDFFGNFVFSVHQAALKKYLCAQQKLVRVENDATYRADRRIVYDL